MEKKLYMVPVALGTLIILGLTGTNVAGMQFEPTLDGTQPEYLDLTSFSNGDIYTQLGYGSYNAIWGFSPNSDRYGWHSCLSVGLGQGAHAASGLVGTLTMTITEPGSYTLGMDTSNIVLGNHLGVKLTNPVTVTTSELLIRDCGWEPDPILSFTDMHTVPSVVAVGNPVDMIWSIDHQDLAYNLSLFTWEQDTGIVNSWEILFEGDHSYIATRVFDRPGNYQWWVSALQLDCQNHIVSPRMNFSVYIPDPPSQEGIGFWYTVPGGEICSGTPFDVEVFISIPATVELVTGR